MNFTRIFPHVSVPGITSQLYEHIEYNKVIGKKTNIGETGVDVLYRILADKVSANTVVGNSSMWRNDIPTNDGSFRQMSIPYYKVESSFSTNDFSEAKFNKMGLGISEYDFKKQITIQAMAQRRAHIVFFGADAKEKQGLFNAASEVVALPADSNSNNKLSSYVPSELLDFLVAQIREIANKSYNMLKPIVIVAPINAINLIKSKIIPINSYLKDAGTASVSQAFQNIVYDINGMQVEFVPCSYMLGKGTANKDIMLFVAPGVEISDEDKQSTAYLNNLNKDSYVNTFMDDALELEEIVNPKINRASSYLFTSIYTPAYTVREDAIMRIEYEY